MYENARLALSAAAPSSFLYVIRQSFALIACRSNDLGARDVIANRRKEPETAKIAVKERLSEEKAAGGALILVSPGLAFRLVLLGG
jgi:hypothetical protein